MSLKKILKIISLFFLLTYPALSQVNLGDLQGPTAEMEMDPYQLGAKSFHPRISTFLTEDGAFFSLLPGNIPGGYLLPKIPLTSESAMGPLDLFNIDFIAPLLIPSISWDKQVFNLSRDPKYARWLPYSNLYVPNDRSGFLVKRVFGIDLGVSISAGKVAELLNFPVTGGIYGGISYGKNWARLSHEPNWESIQKTTNILKLINSFPESKEALLNLKPMELISREAKGSFFFGTFVTAGYGAVGGTGGLSFNKKSIMVVERLKSPKKIIRLSIIWEKESSAEASASLALVIGKVGAKLSWIKEKTLSFTLDLDSPLAEESYKKFLSGNVAFLVTMGYPDSSETELMGAMKIDPKERQNRKDYGLELVSIEKTVTPKSLKVEKKIWVPFLMEIKKEKDRSEDFSYSDDSNLGQKTDMFSIASYRTSKSSKGLVSGMFQKVGRVFQDKFWGEMLVGELNRSYSSPIFQKGNNLEISTDFSAISQVILNYGFERKDFYDSFRYSVRRFGFEDFLYTEIKKIAGDKDLGQTKLDLKIFYSEETIRKLAQIWPRSEKEINLLENDALKSLNYESQKSDFRKIFCDTISLKSVCVNVLKKNIHEGFKAISRELDIISKHLMLSTSLEDKYKKGELVKYLSLGDPEKMEKNPEYKNFFKTIPKELIGSIYTLLRNASSNQFIFQQFLKYAIQTPIYGCMDLKTNVLNKDLVFIKSPSESEFYQKYFEGCEPKIPDSSNITTLAESPLIEQIVQESSQDQDLDVTNIPSLTSEGNPIESNYALCEKKGKIISPVVLCIFSLDKESLSKGLRDLSTNCPAHSPSIIHKFINRPSEVAETFVELSKNCQKIDRLIFAGHGTQGKTHPAGIDIETLSDEFDGLWPVMSPNAKVRIESCHVGSGCLGKLLMFKLGISLLRQGGTLEAPKGYFLQTSWQHSPDIFQRGISTSGWNILTIAPEPNAPDGVSFKFTETKPLFSNKEITQQIFDECDKERKVAENRWLQKKKALSSKGCPADTLNEMEGLLSYSSEDYKKFKDIFSQKIEEEKPAFYTLELKGEDPDGHEPFIRKFVDNLIDYDRFTIGLKDECDAAKKMLTSQKD